MQIKAKQNASAQTDDLEQKIYLDVQDGGMSVEVGLTDDAALYTEYGTRFMDAHPSIKPAFDSQKRKFRKDMEKFVR